MIAFRIWKLLPSSRLMEKMRIDITRETEPDVHRRAANRNTEDIMTIAFFSVFCLFAARPKRDAASGTSARVYW